MRVPLLLTFCISLSGSLAFATEPITVVSGRWDWGAVKFDEEAQKDLRKGDLEGARRNIDEAIRRGPNYWPVYYNRARLFAAERKWGLALRDCNEVLKRDSTFVPAALLRAQINSHIGNYAAARTELDHLIAIQPRAQFFAMAYTDRAWFRATCPNQAFRNPNGAIDDAKKACTIAQWKEADSIDTLATAYAAVGDFDSAVRYEEQAMKAPDANEMSRSLEEHMAMFKQHRPIRMK
jgi:tetratricopeptide (TPR) repeat protein